MTRGNPLSIIIRFTIPLFIGNVGSLTVPPEKNNFINTLKAA